MEGYSAGGTAKQGRDRRFQAILPLRGKILNVEKAMQHRIFDSEEIKNIFTALGVTVGTEEDSKALNTEKLRYHKIIIMTDADVDGQHIQTLLMTFFYRYMPQAIDKGYIYVAKPPLYGVSRGKTQIYLQNQREMDDYLMEQLSTDGLIQTSAGEQISGADLKRLLSMILNMKNILKPLENIIPLRFLEALALNNVFGNENSQTYAAAEKMLDAQELEFEKGWKISSDLEGLKISRTLRSVAEVYVLPRDKMDSAEVRSWERMTGRDELVLTFSAPVELRVKNKSQKIWGALKLLSTAFEYAQTGLKIQRYKGLGEMNSEQLWETTMDPEKRTLLKATVEDAIAADEIFTILMGDKVEPRREFIQKNAKKVSNLDI